MGSWAGYYSRYGVVRQREAQASRFNNTTLPQKSRGSLADRRFDHDEIKAAPEGAFGWPPHQNWPIRIQERSPPHAPTEEDKGATNGSPALDVHPLRQAALDPIPESWRPTQPGGSASQSFLLHKSTHPSSPSPLRSLRPRAKFLRSDNCTATVS